MSNELRWDFRQRLLTRGTILRTHLRRGGRPEVDKRRPLILVQDIIHVHGPLEVTLDLMSIVDPCPSMRHKPLRPTTVDIAAPFIHDECTLCVRLGVHGDHLALHAFFGHSVGGVLCVGERNAEGGFDGDICNFGDLDGRADGYVCADCGLRGHGDGRGCDGPCACCLVGNGELEKKARTLISSEFDGDISPASAPSEGIAAERSA